jgi:hypothetical protein
MRQFAIVVALAVQTTACTSQSPPPQQQIDVVGIKSELLAIGQAERQYFVAHSTYGSLDDLEQDKLLIGGANRRGYVFAVQTDGSQGFTVTATPQDPDKQNWPTLTVDQTMQVTQR